jgi:hypothetical protein
LQDTSRRNWIKRPIILDTDRKVYVIPKQGEKREDQANKVIDRLISNADVAKNASSVDGINIIEVDYKFVRLLDEAYKSFLLGLYYSTISLCSIATERLCYDILEKSSMKFNERIINYKNKKKFFKIPYSALLELLHGIGLVTGQTESDMFKMNRIRQRYVHPLLEGNLYQDARDSINLLCWIIDSFTAGPGSSSIYDTRTYEINVNYE